MSLRWSRWLRHILVLVVTLTSCNTWADYTLNMTPGVSTISQEIHRLHMLILWVCVAIGVVVYSLMIYAIFRHRKSRGHQAAEFHESTTVEVIWTIIPFVILIAMAVPATRTLIAADDVRDAQTTIKITGHRWFWQYDYLDEEIHFFSYLSTPENEINNTAPKNPHYLLEVDKPLVVPVGQKIRFLITSQDVIHSWWVPALGVKRDGIPGFINEIWTYIDEDKPGVYRGQCAELCGTKHGYMPIVVDARPESEYRAWVAQQQAEKAKAEGDADKVWTKEALMVQGEKVYQTVCAMCHQSSGQGMPPTFPSLVGSPIVTHADQKMEHIKRVLHGKNAMPGFDKQLNDLDIAAIVTYERNAWGNHTGDVIQPSDVKKAREAH